jgi:superfamily I DNA/RNA helicase
VFVIGCEERLLPTRYAIDSGEALRTEEERRLFYVAATRAKDRLTLSAAAERLGSSTQARRALSRRPDAEVSHRRRRQRCGPRSTKSTETTDAFRS